MNHEFLEQFFKWEHLPESLMNHEFLEQFFKWEHLPAHLQEISRPFGLLATDIISTLPNNEERHTAIRKLLEAKDCAVRAKLAK